MSTYSTLLSIFSMAIVLYCGSLIGDKHKLKEEIHNQELTIVKLEGKVVDQESEIKILEKENESKKLVIASLKEQNQAQELASQETIDRLLELSNIQPAEGPINCPPAKNETVNSDAKQPDSEKSPDPAAGKTKHDTSTGESNETYSKKFINLRNNIYSRYR